MNSPVPLLPPTNVEHIPFLAWLVQKLDEYRDIRLLWTILEAALMVIILFMVVYFVWGFRAIDKAVQEQFQTMDSKMEKIQDIYKRIDKLEGRE